MFVCSPNEKNKTNQQHIYDIVQNDELYSLIWKRLLLVVRNGYSTDTTITNKKSCEFCSENTRFALNNQVNLH